VRVHENLEVWKKAIELVVDIYNETAEFPSDERFGLISQLRRAAVSIPSNIAEGAARSTAKDKLRFLSMAQGSMSEVDTQLVISSRLGYLSEDNLSKLLIRTEELAKMMYGWARHLRTSDESN
jgi:four helix bundle protein